MIETKSFYLTYKEMQLDIEALNKQIESWTQQRSNWIRRSGPHEVHAQAYDLDKGSTGVFLTETGIIEEISKLTVMISIAETNRDIACTKFSELKATIKRTKEAVDEKGKIMKVFVSMVIDGKSAQETAEIHHLEIQTVYNYNVLVKREMNGTTAS